MTDILRIKWKRNSRARELIETGEGEVVVGEDTLWKGGREK
jgi:hypothetical protein